MKSENTQYSNQEIQEFAIGLALTNRVAFNGKAARIIRQQSERIAELERALIRHEGDRLSELQRARSYLHELHQKRALIDGELKITLNEILAIRREI